jgi:hypothetical protein
MKRVVLACSGIYKYIITVVGKSDVCEGEGLYERVILKRVLKKQVLRAWTI